VGMPSKQGPWHELYSTMRWQRIRRYQLSEHPLCKLCAETGKVTPAEVVDHIEPHGGDRLKFFCGMEGLQSLCKRCHDSAKKQIEQHGYRRDIGFDGWPLDPRHPVYTRKR
jgi:5-methylcytosine-specific restriction protein A